MKKYIFSAIACVAFAGGLLASNDNNAINNNLVNNSNTQPQSNFQDADVIAESKTVADFGDPKRPCTIYVTIYNPDGTTGSLKEEGGEMTWSACGDHTKKYLSGLQERNIKFSDDDVKVIWG